MKISVYTPAQQAIGAFDGGKITEQKPIGFPGEKSEVERIGPLFYWAWAEAEEEGFIPSHPHRAFEIITYVVNGKAEHGDSLGTKSIVGPGGLQVMQTGSGVSHHERFIGPNMEGFQIWFEPYLKEAFKRPPTYSQYEHEDFPTTKENGTQFKTVIGEGSPVQLVADVKMWDSVIEAGQKLELIMPIGYTLCALAIRGGGKWNTNGTNGKQITSFHHKDFILFEVTEPAEVVIQVNKDEPLRIILVQVPTQVDYPLYPNR
jgi:redox-sensitive bicupin YhaK (pirin superfamily)